MTAIEYLQAIWHQTPAPAKTFVTAAAGAVFGAWLTSRAQKKKAIVEELRALRGAQALCFSIANRALAIKRQHTRPMQEAFDKALMSFEAALRDPGGILRVEMDMRTLSQTTFPSDVLEKIVFEKCALGGEGMATAVALKSATDDLKQSFEMRNALVTEFRDNFPEGERAKIARYLGLPEKNTRDERIKDNVRALFSQTDDCIFFARRLADKILIAENFIRKKNWWRFRLPGQKMKPARWDIAEKAGLLPLDAEYVDWLRGFTPDPTLYQRLTKRLFGNGQAKV